MILFQSVSSNLENWNGNELRWGNLKRVMKYVLHADLDIKKGMGLGSKMEFTTQELAERASNIHLQGFLLSRCWFQDLATKYPGRIFFSVMPEKDVAVQLSSRCLLTDL